MPALATMDDFEALLNESFELETPEEGTVVKGTVLAIEAGQAIIDIGYKMEGRVDLKEFTPPGKAPEIAVGDVVEVYLDRVENARGEAVLRREKARREEAWDRLEKAYEKEERVEGAIFGRVKGGFTVDLGGAVAFLPGSQVDVRPVRDAGPLMHMPQPFQILKMDRRRGNIVVSPPRRARGESRAEQRAEIVARLAEGDVIDGVVKNITEYGAFVDLGGVDGLLHVTDMAWRRVNHPSEILGIGETVKVQVIKINKDTQRISLGMKQLQADPWDTVEEKFPIGSKHTGRVTNITDYGAFVELEPGIEGLVHVSEMSWTKKNVHPGKIVSTSQEVEVIVLEIDGQKRRVSLGLKQTQGNPWENFAAHAIRTARTVEGEVKNITEFGLFVGLDGDIDGMVHLSDLDWNRSGEEAIQAYHKGDIVKAVVTDVDVEKERISLSIKAVEGDPFADAIAGVKRGDIVTVTVTSIEDGGIEVEYDGMKTFIRRSDLCRDRSEQRPERFTKGDHVDARVVSIDAKARKLGLSIKAREIAEEKEAVEQYGSSDSGASLGDILGAALRSARTTPERHGRPRTRLLRGAAPQVAPLRVLARLSRRRGARGADRRLGRLERARAGAGACRALRGHRHHHRRSRARRAARGAGRQRARQGGGAPHQLAGRDDGRVGGALRLAAADRGEEAAGGRARRGGGVGRLRRGDRRRPHRRARQHADRLDRRHHGIPRSHPGDAAARRSSSRRCAPPSSRPSRRRSAPTNPAARAREEALVAESYRWFRGLVGERRGLEGAALDAVANGGVFTGRLALENGLIDEIGGEPEALAWLELRDAGLARLPVREWEVEREGPLGGRILGQIAPTGGILGEISRWTGPKLYSIGP